MEKSSRVALYIRVSTGEQTEGHSLAAQEAVLRKDVQLRGKTVYRVYQDAGVSGAKADRKGLKALLRDAKKNSFGEVVVWTVSRISRNLSYLLQIVEDLGKWGITFRSVSEEFDLTTPMGQFALTMMGAVAQMQRESWMESSHIGMEKRAKSGRWGGGMMLGYQVMPDPDDPRGGRKLTMVPQEAQIVQEIFEWYAAGVGYKAIVNRLNQKGIVTKYGKTFSIATIQRILVNPVYIGKTRWKETFFDGVHEPIIHLNLWEAVQKRMTAKTSPIKKTITKEYFLVGLLRCPTCGRSMIPTHTKQKVRGGGYRYYYYYACSGYMNQGKAVCRANSVPAEQAENQVFLWLEGFFKSPFWLKRVSDAITKRYEAETIALEQPRIEIETRIEKLTKSQSMLLTNYENDVLDKSEFMGKMQQLKAKKETLQSRLVELEEDVEPTHCWKQEEIAVAFEAFHDILRQTSSEQKRRLVHQLISKIWVDESRKVVEMELRLMPIAEEDQSEKSLFMKVTL